MIKRQGSLLFFLFLILFSQSASAQNAIDTLRYSAVDAEKVFLQNNLPLLAEKLNISQADARILQAKAWPNPNFTLDELQVYRNATTDDVPPIFGDFWRDRNFAVQLEQLILTAGKRKKNINLQTQNKDFAELMFTDLLQALKAEFRQTVSEVKYLQSVRGSYTIQLTEVNRLLNAQQTQMKQGYISQAELYRLKALQISLQGEINALGEQMARNQKSLKTLMYAPAASYIIITDGLTVADIQKIKERTLPEIIGLAKNNALLKAAGSQVKISEAALAVEQANRVPNLNLIANYDRNGSTMRNFVGVGFSIDLPVFDRNKGNIQAAKLDVEKSTILQKNKAAEVNNAIVQHWSDLNQSINLYESIDADYIEKLDNMTTAISRNFAEHNISLLQFLDYYESFRDSKEKYYDAIKDIINKKEDLNYLIGGEL